MRKRILSVFLAVLLIIGLIPSNFMVAQAQDAPQVAVSVINKLDVALAVGATDIDYSTFASDLKQELKNLGNVPEEKVTVSELETNAVGTSSNFAWWTYDHTANSSIINDTDHNFIEKTASGNNNGHAYYSLDRHILVTNGGADLGFRGYGASGYKDFMYLENTDPTKKTFQFDIQEGVAYDALDGVGFLFNTGVTGSYLLGTQTMSGYLLFLQYNTSGRGQEISLYQFTNINTKNFHEGTLSGLISSAPGFTKLASSSAYTSTDSFRKVRIEVQPKKVKVWYKGSTAAITDNLTDNDIVSWTAGGSSSTELTISPSGYYGFGPLGSYRPHDCERLTSIDLKNLTMSTEEPKSLTEVVREPEWQENSERFIVNLNNQPISEFNDIKTMGEIINRLQDKNINYIGWGSNANATQTTDFINLNNQRGTLVNVDAPETTTYQQQIHDIALAILAKYRKNLTGVTVTVITTDEVELAVDGADATDTADENWPDGKWKIIHDPSGFDNVDGIYEYSGQYVSDLNPDFSRSGKYEIYYEDVLVKTIISNEKPVAAFEFQVVSGSAISVDTVSGSAVEEESVSGSALEIGTVSGAAIVYTDRSYDPDDLDGIDQSKTVWKYMNLSDSTLQWIESGTPISQIGLGESYLVSLVVTDIHGSVSLPYTRLISYSEEDGVKSAPYADFELSTSYLYPGSGDSTVTMIDKSYDSYNAPLNYSFTVTKNGSSYSKVIQFGANDFSNEGEGTYKIGLTVTSVNGTSQMVTRTVKVVTDRTAPTATCNVADDTTTGNNRIILSFTDMGGSGFKGQKVALTDSNTAPSADSSSWTTESNQVKRVVTMPLEGIYFLHYITEDKAGNQAVGTFGPFHYEVNNPYVSQVIAPENNSTGVSINSNLVFQMSEKVKKGNGYITVYNRTTNKKVVELHSSNNRVKISNSGLVTVELTSSLDYNTAYYVVVGTGFVLDMSNKQLAQYGGIDEWSFQTQANGIGQSNDSITISKIKVTQEGSEPSVNVDVRNPKSFFVYVKAGEFSLTPVLSNASDNISIAANDCTASLSADKKTVTVDLTNGAADPYITFTIGNSNTYTFKIVQTDKELKAAVNSSISFISTTSNDNNLLNAVDLTNDIADGNVSKINVRLLLREPQNQQQAEDVAAYAENTLISDHVEVFDATLLKTITYNDNSSNESNISNTQEAIVIIIDIPAEYRNNYNYTILRNHNGQIEELQAYLINNGTQLKFETDRFSTYAIAYKRAANNGNTPIVDSPAGADDKTKTQEKIITIPTSINVKAGEYGKVVIENLPKGAVVRYHITTPTIISVGENGSIFGKLQGEGIIIASVTASGESTWYKIIVNVDRSDKKPTKVGYIQYYDKLINYNNVNYRITKEATSSAVGFVAVGNNQTNTKLPSDLVIPATIKIKGKTYKVTSIDESAFYYVKILKSVSIPKSVVDISATAFTACHGLKKFTVSADNKYYSANKAMLLNKKGNKLISYPSATGKLVISSNITNIGAYALSVSKNLTEVVIPDSVKVIDGCAFAHSKALKTINFKGKVPEIVFPSVFDAINANAVINVNAKYLDGYKKTFQGAMQPEGVKFKTK